MKEAEILIQPVFVPLSINNRLDMTSLSQHILFIHFYLVLDKKLICWTKSYFCIKVYILHIFSSSAISCL